MLDVLDLKIMGNQWVSNTVAFHTSITHYFITICGPIISLLCWGEVSKGCITRNKAELRINGKEFIHILILILTVVVVVIIVITIIVVIIVVLSLTVTVIGSLLVVVPVEETFDFRMLTIDVPPLGIFFILKAKDKLHSRSRPSSGLMNDVAPFTIGVKASFYHMVSAKLLLAKAKSQMTGSVLHE